MKIFFTTTLHGIDSDLDQVCPFHSKIKDREHPFLVGSNACCRCPYCYGYGQHPNPWHKLAFLPMYSIYSITNNGRSETEISNDGLKNFKAVSEDNYIKCMLAFSEQGQRMFRNRFKLWWWKHIGERLSNTKCYIIDAWVNLKVKCKYPKL